MTFEEASRATKRSPSTARWAMAPPPCLDSSVALPPTSLYVPPPPGALQPSSSTSLPQPPPAQPTTTLTTPTMNAEPRASRHILITGLSPELAKDDDKLRSYFTRFGEVEKIKFLDDEGESSTSEEVSLVVSFSDTRCAQKAINAEQKLDVGSPFRVTFYEPKRSLASMTTCLVPQPSSSTTTSGNPVKTESSGQQLNQHQGEQQAQMPSDYGRDARRAKNRGSSSNSARRLDSAHRKTTSNRSEDCTSSSTTGGTSSGGLQGIYIEKLPPRSDGTVKDAIRDSLKKTCGRIVEVRIESHTNDASSTEQSPSRRALVIFQRISDYNKLVSDLNHSLSLLGQHVRVKSASASAVLDAYNDFLTDSMMNSGGQANSHASSSSSSTADKPSSSSDSRRNRETSGDDVSVFSSKASRTLYVGGLEFRTSEEQLRQRFARYGDILEIDVKNPESPKPFAFIQYSDIDSVCKAINSSRSEAKREGKKDRFAPRNPNFGRSLPQPKIWIGRLPPSVTEEYVVQKLKTLGEGVVDVVVDMKIHQAIIVFNKNENATHAYARIRQGKPKPFVFKVADGSSGEWRVACDYCSDRLHDFFVDRKHQQITTPSGHPSSSGATNSKSSEDPTASGSLAQADSSTHSTTKSLSVDTEGYNSSGQPLLAPPPDPPAEMPSYRHDTYYRDNRRVPSPHSHRRRDRSRERVIDRPDRAERIERIERVERGVDRVERSIERAVDRGLDRQGSRYARACNNRHINDERRNRRKRDKRSDSSTSSSESISLSQQSSSQSSRSATPNNYKQRTDRQQQERLQERVDRAGNGKRREERSRRDDKERTTNGKSSRSSTRHRSPKYTLEKQRFIDEAAPPIQTTGVGHHTVNDEKGIGDRKSGDSGFYDDPSRNAPLDPPPPPPPLQSALPSPPPADPPPIPPQQAHSDLNRFHTSASVVPAPGPMRHSPTHRSASHDIISPRTPHSAELAEQQGMIYRTHPYLSSHPGLIPSTSSFDTTVNPMMSNFYATAPPPLAPIHYGSAPALHNQPPPPIQGATSAAPTTPHRGQPPISSHHQQPMPQVHHQTGQHSGGNPSPQKRSSFDGGKGGEHHSGKRPIRWPWGAHFKGDNHPAVVKLEPDRSALLDDPRLRHPRHSVPIALYKFGWFAQETAMFASTSIENSGVVRERLDSVTREERRKTEDCHQRLSLKLSSDLMHGQCLHPGPSSSGVGAESDEQLSPMPEGSLLPPPPSAIDSLVETTVKPVVDSTSLKERLYTFGSKFLATESPSSRSVELERDPFERVKSEESEPKAETFAEKLEKMKKNRSTESSLSFDFPSLLKGAKGPPFSASSVSPTDPSAANASAMSLSSSGFSRNQTSGQTPSQGSARPALSITIPQPTGSSQTPSTASTPTSGRNTESPLARLANTSGSGPSAISTSSQPHLRTAHPPPSAPAMSVSTPVSRHSGTTPGTAPVGFGNGFGMLSGGSSDAGHHSPVISAPPQPPLLNPSRDRRDSVSSWNPMRSPPVTPASAPRMSSTTATALVSATSPSLLPSRQLSSSAHNATTSSSSAASTPKSHIGLPRTQQSVPGVRQDPQKIASRHDSFSSIRSPSSSQFHQPPPALSSRSMSTPDAAIKKPGQIEKGKETSPAIQPPTTSSSAWFNQMYAQGGKAGMAPQPSDISKLPRIQKKSQTSSSTTIQGAPQTVAQGLAHGHISTQEHKHEHKKEKEHKPRKKEDGTYETKEERAIRKAKEKEKKAKKEHKEHKKDKHKKDRKKDREDRSIGGAEKRERKTPKEKKDKEKEKKREQKAQKKKQRRYSSDEEEESDSDEDHSLAKSMSKQLAEAMEDGGLVGGLSMYDRVKRRSSAANRDDGAKKAALSAIREKTNEKKGTQKKGRVVAMTSSDEEEEAEEGGGGNEGHADESGEDESEEEVEVEAKKKASSSKNLKEARVPISTDEESIDEERQQIASTSSKRKKEKKKKQSKEAKILNMKDVFGEGTTDDEVGNKEKKKRNKKKDVKKETISEDSDEPAHKKAKRATQELDLEAIFGKDRPSKKSKKEDKAAKKRAAEEEVDKDPLAKRPKKEESLDSRSDWSDDGKRRGGSVASGSGRERKSSDATRSSTSDVAEAIERELLARKDSGEQASTSVDQNASPFAMPTAGQPLSSNTAPAEVKEEARPKLMTKAAMKVFEPPASQSGSLTAHETGTAGMGPGAGTSDSSSDSMDTDDELESNDDASSSRRTPSLSLSTASGQDLRRKLAEKSLDSLEHHQGPSTQNLLPTQSHVPLSQQVTLSSSSVCSESDNDSQMRSPRRPVELVDATAGYEPVRKNEEEAQQDNPLSEALVAEAVQGQVKEEMLEKEKQRTTAEEDEDAKAANDIASEDVFVFDDGEEGTDGPLYPPHDFMESGSGDATRQQAIANVKEETQETRQQAIGEQPLTTPPLHSPPINQQPAVVVHTVSNASSASLSSGSDRLSERLLSPPARSSAERQLTPLSAMSIGELASPNFPGQQIHQSQQAQLHLPIQPQPSATARPMPISSVGIATTSVVNSTTKSPVFQGSYSQQALPQTTTAVQQQIRLPTVPSAPPPTTTTQSTITPTTASVIHENAINVQRQPSSLASYSLPTTTQQLVQQQAQQGQQNLLPQAAAPPSVSLPTQMNQGMGQIGSLTHGIAPTTTAAMQGYMQQMSLPKAGGQSSTPQAAASPVPRQQSTTPATSQAQAQALAQHQRDVTAALMQQLYGQGQVSNMQQLQQLLINPAAHALLQQYAQLEQAQAQAQQRGSPAPQTTLQTQQQAAVLHQQQQQQQAAYQRQQAQQVAQAQAEREREEHIRNIMQQATNAATMGQGKEAGNTAIAAMQQYLQQQQQQQQFRGQQEQHRMSPSLAALQAQQQQQQFRQTPQPLKQQMQNVQRGYSQPETANIQTQYPPLWYGQLAMKTNDTQLGLYYIGGNKELFYRSFGPAPQSGQKKTVIKVNQRMRLDQSQSIVHKLQDVERHVTCVGVCAGVNPDNCRENEIKLKSHFINYFNQKEIAGIALTTEEPPFEASRVHIFAPGPLAANYLQVHAPSLYNHLQSKEMAFLFFIISPPE